MKYIKLFEEKWEQPDRAEELLDFTNDYLAYLTDDGFKFQVNSGDFTSNVYEVIRIRKGDNPFYINGGDPNLDKEHFTWDQIKDYMLPYLIMLDRRYTIAVVTFFTERLDNSLSYTREGAARIKDLLGEKIDPHYYNWNSNVNPRSQIFEEIRIKILKLPISKVEEGFDRWSRDQKNELTEYCETNLAYLMDEGFKIRVGQQYTSLPDKWTNVSIGIKKESLTFKQRAERGVEREDFNWGDIKDHFIPFCVRLEKEYEISEIKILGPTINLVIRDNFENQLDKLSTEVVSYIDIYLSGEKEQLNESLSPKEELEDFCDTHLAYLTDEGFSIDYEELYGGHYTNVTIRHLKRDENKYSYDFSWDEIKDRFIPFLHILSKEYKLFNFHFEDIACKKDEVVYMNKLDDLLSKNYYSYEDVVEDTINADYLFYIRLKVGRKLT